ncbi:MAG: ArnT family glycosyltransferase [Almyronema sp.]
MPVILPFLALVLLIPFWQQRLQDWRRAVLLAALSWGVLITVTTEVVSLFHGLSLVGLLPLWLLIDGGLIAVMLRQRPLALRMPPLPSSQIPLSLKLMLVGVIVIVAVVGFIALFAAPNNWDSMTYHLGRVVHWIQNRSVDHYPTGIIRQLYPGPWSSFAIAQLQILSGGDYFANSVQWLSWVASLVGVSLIAQQLGANLRGQVLSVVICATIPMGILQGSTTQSDHVVGLWLVCLAFCVLQAIQSKFTQPWMAVAGVSLGLALLSKGTAYLYAFPFCLWLVFSGFRRLRWHLWQPLATFGAIALVLNVGHYSRNWQVFGSVLGESGQGLDSHGPRVLLSNVIRNLALHFGTPVRSINLITIRLVEGLHTLIGLDASDPRLTSPPGQRFDIHSLINHEDLAGNPLHVLLFVGATVVFWVTVKQLRQRQRDFLAAYWLAVVVGFLMFCGLIIWSPWRSRLHLPVFVLATPFMGVVLAQMISRRLVNAIAAILLGASLIWVGFSENRPLFVNSQIIETGQAQNIFNRSRTEQYFLSKPDLQTAYLESAAFIRTQACSEIGLKLSGDAWEYPLWVMLGNHAKPTLRIEHVEVDNASANKADSGFVPCTIIADDVAAGDRSEIVAFQNTYQRQLQVDALSIFMNQSISTQSSSANVSEP